MQNREGLRYQETAQRFGFKVTPHLLPFAPHNAVVVMDNAAFHRHADIKKSLGGTRGGSIEQLFESLNYNHF